MKCIKHYDFTNQTSLDRNEWNIQVGEKWANHELQHYVDNEKNLYFNQGLVIEATYQDGIYHSSRINTKGKFAFQYGKIDIIAKVPKGQGTWPALWMMPEQFTYGDWPKSGEIDIMEHSGQNVDLLFLAVHTEGYNHRQKEQYDTRIQVPGLSDDFQKFSLLWDEKSITYFLNDEQVARYEKGMNNRDTSHVGWPFDHKFHLIINLAIGGMFGGTPNSDDYPQQFIIKDIKVYQ